MCLQESRDGSEGERRFNRLDYTSQRLRTLQRNHRRLREQTRQLRERLQDIPSALSDFSTSEHDVFARNVQVCCHGPYHLHRNAPCVRTVGFHD